jgi:hypothetical protein
MGTDKGRRACERAALLVHRLISGKPTPRGADGALADFPRCSFLRTDQSMLVARALKIGQIADGGMPPTYETMH